MAEMKKYNSREEIPLNDKWDIESMYINDNFWDEELISIKARLNNVLEFKGKLNESAELLLNALEEKNNMWQVIEKLYVYARMKKDENNKIDKYQSMCDKAGNLVAQASAIQSFFVPELIKIPKVTINKYIEENFGLKIYEHYLNDIIRQKAHVLGDKEEEVIANLSELSGATNTIFGMINNADIDFGSIKDESGNSVKLTHGKYSSLMESTDRKVRKSAFLKIHKAYGKLKNTLAANYNYNTKNDAIYARIRKYNSALDSALERDQIPMEVYDNLIKTVNENLNLLHRYVDIRKKILGLSEIHLYDMYVPLASDPRDSISYSEGVAIVKNGLTPLGNEYINTLEKSINERWVDVYENEGKTSGAYSFGSYDSLPFVLLNYNYKLKDVFTLAHELGHSMHSYYTRKTQPFIYGSHSIFTAEVASTVNETLLINQLIKNTSDKKELFFLLNYYIEEFRTTVFRQTMFAEFEKLTHEAVEAGEVLTPDFLSSKYENLVKKYFGTELTFDKEAAFEWARIPHFYNAFYVYQYATGYSAAAYLSQKILEGDKEAISKYITFLESGEKDYPINILKEAGVDMSSPEPIRNAMKNFEELLNKLEELL
jgi:oligoendopeptidase F